MTLASRCSTIISGAERPPWETAPLGVVSLFDMLEFSAGEYVEISHLFGLIQAACRVEPLDGKEISNTLKKLLIEADRLGLPVTREAISQLLLELVKANPGGVQIEGEGRERVVRVATTLVDTGRVSYHFECIYFTLKAELKSLQFRVIPSAKALYCEPSWLFESSIYKKFPKAWKEFQAAGRCYAFGENTACAFHLQRALEWGLKSLAVHLDKRFDRNSWENHLEDIEKELTARYKAAGQRTSEQKFHSETAAQFGHMKVAWRNPTMHIEAKYDEREAAYLLVTIENFMTHLADNGLKEAQA